MLTQQVQRRANRSRPDRRNYSPPRRSGGANDNSRLRLLEPQKRRRLGKLKNLGRLNPYLNLALLTLGTVEILRNFQEEKWINLGSWYKYADCGALKNPLYVGPWGKGANTSLVASASIASSTLSGLQGQGTSYVGDPWAGVPTYARSVGLGKTIDAFGSPRMQYQQAFTRPASGAFTKPELQLERLPVVQPVLSPALWPLTADPSIAPPFQAPEFSPPVPWRLNPVWEAPNRVAQNSASRNRPESPYGDVVFNDWSIAVNSVGARSQAHDAPKTHRLATATNRKNSGSTEKETKRKMSHDQIMMIRALSSATEARDFIDALYQALPSDYRPRFNGTKYEKLKVSDREKMQALISHGDHIDLVKAIENLLYENFEDAVYGKIGKVGGDVSKRLGFEHGAGINSLNSRLRRSLYEASSDDPDRLDGEN